VLRDPEAAILLGRLLLVFLCNALGGHLVFKDVLQLVSNQDIILNNLFTLADFLSLLGVLFVFFLTL